MAGGFVKLYASILDSSVWAESVETRLLWVTMLAMADENGVVRSSVAGLAHRARISREGCEAGLAVLQAPDPDSGTPDHDGRRIERTEGGWLVLNHRRYRDMRTDSQAKAAERARRFRERVSGDRGESRGSVTRNGRNAVQRAEAEAEAEGEGEKEKRAPLALPAALDTPEFRQAWADWLAYRREARFSPWKPVTVGAKLAELAEWGSERAVKAIRQSIANGWRGLFDRDEKQNVAKAAAVHSGALSDADRAALRKLGQSQEDE